MTSNNKNNQDDKKHKDIKKAIDELKGKEEKQKDPKKEEFEKYKELSEEYKSTLQRLQADFENYKKHVEKERAQISKRAISEFVCKLLPVLDSFQNALKEDNEGVKLIYGQLHTMLKKEGLEEIKCVNTPFDPYLHEAMMQVDGDDDDMIIEEFQKGYRFKDTIVRHSKVKITKKREEKKDDPEKNN